MILCVENQEAVYREFVMVIDNFTIAGLCMAVATTAVLISLMRYRRSDGE